MEFYKYRAVRRGPARLFYRAHEDSLRAKLGHRKVAFCLHDVVFFFAKAAAEGVIGNLAFAAILKLVKVVRKPKQELVPSDTQFEAVVSRRNYNRLRQERHPEGGPLRTVPTILTRKVEVQYRLMVKLKRSG